jgi:tetratricopeptide (TPR) repeat protein
LLARVVLTVAATVALVAFAPAARAQAGRLLSDAAVSERDDHLDLAIEFSCTMRYQTHAPASEGASVRVVLQPGPDCGVGPGFPTERLLPADDPGVVRGIELTPGLAGGAELAIAWNRVETWVLAPSSGMRGLRVRVLRRRGATVLLDDSAGVAGTLAVNLESTRDPVPPEALAVARERLKAPVYVSETVLDDERWYRLRAGPFGSRREAEAVLRTAQADYPRAWLAIDDERSEPAADAAGTETLPVASGAAVPRPAGGERRADPALDERLLRARRALSARRLDEAVAALTQILASPDYQRRAEAQELLGLARERKAQLAHAKAEYEEYLRRYPDGAAAVRIRTRLDALRRASVPGRRGSGGAGGADDRWQLFGYAAQLYRRDDSQLRTQTLDRRLVSQNAVLTDMDFVARRRGERFGLVARTSGGYTHDLQPDGPASGARVVSAYLDMQDRELGWGARMGRQSRGMPGILGTFDGLLGNWQAGQRLRFSAAAGMPVDSSSTASSTDRRFLGLSGDWTLPGGQWDAGFYALQQQYAGETDRQSLGTEWRYLGRGRSLIAMFDYDLHFAAVNHVFLLGTARLPADWTASVNASQQRSPALSLRNALIGQDTREFDVLRQRFTLAELEQIAADRSAELRQFGVSASHPWGDRAQVFVDASSLQLAGTGASGGVEAIPAQGSDLSLGGELMVNSVFRAGDVQSIALRVQQGGFADSLSLGFGSRWPIGGAWRLMVRARVDQRRHAGDGTTQWLYLPSLRVDRATRSSVLEFEAGTEMTSRDVGTSTEHANRLFFSLGYRLSFDWVRR